MVSSAAASFVGLVVIAWRMPSLFSLPASIRGETQVAMIVAALGVSATIALSVPTMVIIGHGRSDLLSKRSLILGLSTAGLQCALAAAGTGVIGVCAASAAGSIATAAIGVVLQRRVWVVSSPHQAGVRTPPADLLREGLANFVISIAGTAAFTSDTIILGAIASLPAIAAYTLASKLPGLIRVLTSRGIDLLQPTYSHFSSTDEGDRQRTLLAVLSRATRFSCAAAITLGIAACSSGDLLLHVWVGKIPPKTSLVMAILMAGTVLQMFGHAIYVFLTGVRRLRRLLIFSVVSATINVGLSVLLAAHIGAPGPATASLICVCVGDLTIVPSIAASALGIPPVRLLRELLTAPLLPALPALALVLAARVPSSSGWSLLVGGCAAALYACGFIVLIGRMDREYAKGLFRRLAAVVRGAEA